MNPSGWSLLRICGWCGPLTVAVAFFGWLLAGLLPFPLGPYHSAEEVARFYAAGVRVPMGIAIGSVGVSLVIPLVAGITLLMWRSQREAPLLALIQLVSGVVAAVCLLLPMLVMAVAGFRPDRTPELTVLLNDLAWLLFITPIAPFIIQNLAIATFALTVEEARLPRWAGYFNLWVGFTFTFDILAYAFHSGPFAWNGPLIFWLALTSYALWLMGMGSLLIRAAALPRLRAAGAAL